MAKHIKHPNERALATHSVSDFLEDKIHEIFNEHGILLDALLDNYPGAIYFKDLDSRIIRTSAAHARDFGMTTSNPLIGKTDFDLFDEEHAKPAFDDEQSIIKTGKPIVDKVEKEVYPDGRIKYVLTTKLPLKDSNGNIIGTFGISRDISELKRAEKEVASLSGDLEKANKELSNANRHLVQKQKDLEKTIEELKETKNRLITSEKMASLGTFTAGIAHEINNPMNYISSGMLALFDNLKPLLDEYSQKEEMKETMETVNELKSAIFQGIERTTAIVSSLRSYSHSDKSFTSYNIIDGINNALLITEGLYKNRIKVIQNYPAELNIDCIPGEMNQIFTNLMSNAIDSIQNEGKITIAVRSKSSKNIEIRISDTGVGIDAKFQSNLFDPFFTTKEVGKGTGLGLYIVYGIVQKHNGSIEVESSTRKGTTFIVTLPKQRA